MHEPNGQTFLVSAARTPIGKFGGALSTIPATELGGVAIRAAVDAAMPRLLAPFETIDPVVIAPEGLGPRYDVLRTIQAAEAWAAHRDWLDSGGWDTIGASIRARFEVGMGVTQEQLDAAWTARAAIRTALLELLRDDTVIALPTLPFIAPRLDAPEAEFEACRHRSLPLLASAGLDGLPQISIPIGTAEGCPLGLSLIGPAGRDRALIDLAATILAS